MPKSLSRNDCVEVALRPSRIAAAFVLASGAATIALALCISLPPLAGSLCTLWAGFSILAAYRREARRMDRAIRTLRFDSSGAVEAIDAQGIHREGDVRAGSFVASWLTVIRWRPRQSRFERTILILPDMLPPDDFRRLRVLLRWS